VRSPARFIIFLIALLLPWKAHGADVRVRATLNPSEISLNEVTELRVTVEGSLTASAPSIPAVDGLEFVYSGQTSNFQFMNGIMSGGITRNYDVIPRKAGSFTIPEITVEVGKTSYKTQPLALKVNAGNISRPGRPGNPFAPPPPASPPKSSNAKEDGKQPQAAWLQLSYPRRDFFVGELIPLELKVYLHPNLRLEEIHKPALAGDAFSISKLGQPSESIESVDQGRYLVYTWNTLISAIKTGEHPLGAEMQMTILVRDQQTRHLPPGFDDPFFSGFFNVPRPKRVALKSLESKVNVIAPPTESKPASFSGAIGKFELGVSLSSTDVNAGDPVTAAINISGTGNFDRVQSPELSEKVETIKLYSPTARFQASDDHGFAGQKLFEQVVVFQDPALKAFPSYIFSYFDPEARKYVTLKSDPIPLQLKGSPLLKNEPSPGRDSAVGSSTPGSAGASAAPQAGNDLVANKLELGSSYARIPLPLRSVYWISGALLLVAFGLSIIFLNHRRKLAGDPKGRRAVTNERDIQQLLHRLEKEAKSEDATSFFLTARKILQIRFSGHLGIEPEAVTLGEIEARISQAKSGPCWETIRGIFQTADAIAYSGQHFSASHLKEWREHVNEVLRTFK
jgi:hypothetical protein